jgi:eukaryotic-like serine/threonine-protein kinase
MAREDAWEPPTQFEEYRIVRPLGRGGMGQVMLAEDRLLDRLVAIKFIAHASPSEATRARFFVEARAAARIAHPNVVAVHRVGEIQGRPFIVAEYVRGVSLADLGKPVPWRRALALGIDLARGLAAAHRRGVLHRDIKLANAVLSEEGQVKLLDFGLAELLPDVYPPEPSLGDAQPARAYAVTRAATFSDEAPSVTRDLDPRPPRSQDDAALDVTSTLEPEADREPAPTVRRERRPLRIEATVPIVTRAPDRGAPLGQMRAVGTPLYMAPELWNNEPVTARADVYALGVVLYELCAGAPPYGDLALAPLIHAICMREAPPLEALVPDVDPTFAAIVARCLARDVERRFADGDALREALERLAVPAERGAAVPQGNPYRGLLAFDAEHRTLFFGRSAEVLAILDRLRADPFVLVTGDSGTGKSSLCRAGVLPGVAEGALGRPVRIVTVTLGRSPLAGLALALAKLLDEDEAAVVTRLREGPMELVRDIRRTGREVLLFVDQLEELCTQARPEEAAVVAEALYALADPAGGARVLASARSDFLTRLSALPGLGEDLRPALYLLRPLTEARLREAVTGPTAALGFSFASLATVDALVAEAQRAEGGLPLLQFALAELWDARDEATRQIPASALDAVGGVSGALARHADSVLGGLFPAQREDARALLLALVTAEGTREVRPEGELLAQVGDGPGARTALTALVRGRLLVAREDAGGAGSAYTIAHEALLTGWDTLRGWLGHDVEGRALRQRLERSAAEWERLSRAKDALWGDRLLAEAAILDAVALGEREASFLMASRQAVRRRRLRRAATTALVLVLIGLALLGGRINARRELTARVNEAEGAFGQARAARAELEAVRREAFARFDEGKTEPAEKIWAKALTKAAEVEQDYAQLFGLIEVIRLQDGIRKDAQALFADAIYERATLAEQDGRVAERDELVRRLRIEAPGLANRWEAPSRLTIETDPPGATVDLARFVLRDGRYAEVPGPALGRTPIAEMSINPGSVVLTLTRTGSPVVRLPVLLARGEPRRIAIRMPSEGEVPEGFVYVPEGRFLYGSDNESARQYYGSQPMHPVETGAYLIDANETTYGDWIAYLRSVPTSERAAHLPRGEREGFRVELTELAGGEHQLTLGQDPHRAVARTGQMLHYDERERRQDQDWLRFPVTAISFDEAQAYTQWLDRAGRVPGARLCTEREWERAARGADHRAFPGGERLAPDDANFNLTYGRKLPAMGPDEVGAHSANTTNTSDSPFGVHDMAGNVWELTSSTEQGGTPVAKGGCFRQARDINRADNRASVTAASRSAFIGFRVCASLRPR